MGGAWAGLCLLDTGRLARVSQANSIGAAVAEAAAERPCATDLHRKFSKYSGQEEDGAVDGRGRPRGEGVGLAV